MSLGPQDVYEWGDVSLSDVYHYDFCALDFDFHKSSSFPQKLRQNGSLGTALNIQPHADKDQPILILGCGNSKFGEEMIEKGWRGPIIQVDVSSRVIESMSQRCNHLVTTGQMNFVQDDACELSAFRDGMIDASLDKGLIDAVFCADENEQLTKILKAVGRVLRPGGSFVFFSFSRPEFLLPRLMANEMQDVRRRQWTNLEVHELDKILLYRMQKVGTVQNAPLNIRPNRVRKDKPKR